MTDSLLNAKLGTKKESQLAIEYLLSHNLEVARTLLQRCGLPSKGDEPTLRKRIQSELGKAIDPIEITRVLDEVEGWGNQHIVLFQSTDAIASLWKKQATLTEIAKKLDLSSLVNGVRPILLPDEPTLSQIIWSTKHVRFVWVQRRIWHVRREELDERKGDVELRAYEIQNRRGICYFDWNLVSGSAALLMQLLPKATEYKALQFRLLDDLGKWLPIEVLETIGLQALIGKLEASNEVSRRNVVLATADLSEVDIKSGDRNSDAYADKSIVALRKAMNKEGPVASRRGFFYWQIADKFLDRTIPMRVYPKDNRLSIHGQCSESEVQYVLSRVRAVCE
jgi:hypothetical protein